MLFIAFPEAIDFGRWFGLIKGEIDRWNANKKVLEKGLDFGNFLK
jgi:hypothetical protein